MLDYFETDIGNYWEDTADINNTMIDTFHLADFYGHFKYL
jgi:hypothetical protein